MNYLYRSSVILLSLAMTACSTVYLNSLEKIGIPKRDVMVYRVEKARDTQEATKEQFKSALEQFSAVTRFNGGDLEASYKKLNNAYEDSLKKSEEVRNRITDIESVSEALFAEWKQEITQYSNTTLKQDSQKKLDMTQAHYRRLITSMKQAEAKIEPVLRVYKDQVRVLFAEFWRQTSLKASCRIVPSLASSSRRKLILN